MAGRLRALRPSVWDLVMVPAALLATHILAPHVSVLLVAGLVAVGWLLLTVMGGRTVDEADEADAV